MESIISSEEYRKLVFDYLENNFQHAQDYKDVFDRYYGVRLRRVDRVKRLGTASGGKPDILSLLDA